MINQYARHSQTPDLAPQIGDTLARIMQDERWHIEWIASALRHLEGEYGKELIDATLKRFRDADQEVYSKTILEHEERVRAILEGSDAQSCAGEPAEL